MKKLIITLLILMIPFINIAQTIDSTKISETERIIDKYSDKLVNTFNETVTTIAPLAENAFKIVVKLQFIKGIINLIPVIVFLIFFILMLKEYYKIENEIKKQRLKQRREEEHNDYYNSSYGPLDESNITFILVAYIVLSAIFLITSFCTTYTALTHIFVPEWFAIQEIMHLFK